MNNDASQLIDRLEALVSSGKRVPLSTLVMIDEQACLDLIDQLRVSVPDDVKQAKRVTQERDRIISHAKNEADKIIQAAQSEAAKMLEESDVVRAAQDSANSILETAEQRASELQRGADAYVLDALTGLDDELSRLLVQIRRGRSMLERPREQSGPARSDDNSDDGFDLPHR